MKRVVFKIQGMDCAEEVAVLRRIVGPVVGSADYLNCDILNGTMTVCLPEGITNVDTLCKRSGGPVCTRASARTLCRWLMNMSRGRAGSVGNAPASAC